MPRMIIHSAFGPSKVKAQEDKEIWICRCGLTKSSTGECDQSHQKTLSENKQKMYVYDQKQQRQLLEEECQCENCHDQQGYVCCEEA